MKTVEDIIFKISRRRLSQLRDDNDWELTCTLTSDHYSAWRDSELKQQLSDNFDPAAVRGKDVLDFGCGSGALSFHLASLGAKTVTGTDLSAQCLDQAEQAKRAQNIDSVTFHLASDPTHLDLQDCSFDVICCFDVLEHVMFPEQVLRQWHRLLRPAGQVWIWWSPWRHPYGHHMRSLIPLPWVHLFCSRQTLINVAARIYDDPAFVPRVWDIDPRTGQKKPNKWRDMPETETSLNKLTLADFKSLCKSVGLHRTIRAVGFGATGLKKLVGSLAHVPLLGEFFTSYYAIVLQKLE